MQQAQDIFTAVSLSGREMLARGASRHQFVRGTEVVSKGQAVSGAYFVTAGCLRVFTLTPGGKEATLYLIRPGETCVLALNSLFNNVLYPAWVEAAEDTALVVVPGPLYRDLFTRERVIQDVTVQALSTIVFRLMSELEELHSCRLDQRLASFLLNHANGTGEIALTQQQIAGHIGSTREVVARILGEFSGRGWVRTGRGKVALANASGLATLLRDLT
ncbi:Crp/Fnr family transcriptional regulator [Novispirillum sp. DQ9]|uniref:Crp/Fnr family transcriptional regulator n=1 Tax=Novispirillum sp. DQ9 TaxID=3398612 RepID=UPI003C7B8D49